MYSIPGSGMDPVESYHTVALGYCRPDVKQAQILVRIYYTKAYYDLFPERPGDLFKINLEGADYDAVFDTVDLKSTLGESVLETIQGWVLANVRPYVLLDPAVVEAGVVFPNVPYNYGDAQVWKAPPV